ncbi:PREDICTED: tripartite motif-containing protein 65 [Elephantulus edwardii]|uniref:tripartite motif-containing protein 65 n=1 Tax=Elephantulus edwardii TaxID=28737 RepID=UPI0003F0B8D8|nr:PREDICTED: tripartite motif-containing protein 65 [Elephantulus edwardii]
MASLQLEEKLACAICLGLYRDPATLPCGHNFCMACIRDWWAHEVRECPECRQPVPEGTELRRNVALSGLVELVRTEQGRDPPAGTLGEPGTPPAGTPPEPTPGPTVPERSPQERALLDTECRKREVQLRATLEVTSQQAAQAKAQLQQLQQQSSQIQSSACTLASVVSSKFSVLLQALEMRRALALKDIDTAKAQALAKARAEEQRLSRHLEALARHDCRAQELLQQPDHGTFLQESQLLVPPEPLGPLTTPPWDEDQQLGDLKEMLSHLDALLLEEGDPQGVLAEDADLYLVETPGPLVPTPVCPQRQELWQNYCNLTFDPESANRHLHLSRENRRVKHRRWPRSQFSPSSFKLWQVQCVQSFQAGRHYWEVHTSNHSVTLGVTYPELARDKQGTHTDNIGRGPCSWGLCIQEDCTQAWHNGEARRLPAVTGHLLGVDLDVASGRLTFYSLEPQVQPLHTFHAVFTQPLHAVFWLLEGRTLTLCHRPRASHLPDSQGSQEGASELIQDPC